MSLKARIRRLKIKGRKNKDVILMIGSEEPDGSIWWNGQNFQNMAELDKAIKAANIRVPLIIID